jgi:hypothetical protein
VSGSRTRDGEVRLHPKRGLIATPIIELSARHWDGRAPNGGRHELRSATMHGLFMAIPAMLCHRVGGFSAPGSLHPHRLTPDRHCDCGSRGLRSVCARPNPKNRRASGQTSSSARLETRRGDGDDLPVPDPSPASGVCRTLPCASGTNAYRGWPCMAPADSSPRSSVEMRATSENAVRNVTAPSWKSGPPLSAVGREPDV